MKIQLLSFGISLLAGLSTLIGYLLTYIPVKHQERIICGSLAFSAGVMLSVSIFSLLPEAFQSLTNTTTHSKVLILMSLFLLGGLLSIGMDQIFSHHIKENSLYKVGIISFISLFLHNIPEGITTFLTTSANLKLGLTLSLAIALHNIPEGIAIAIPIYYATKNHLKAFIYTFFSGFSEFFGTLFAYFFLKDYIQDISLAFVLGTTAGIMCYLSFLELIPEAFSYHHRKYNTVCLILGFLILYLCISILK